MTTPGGETSDDRQPERRYANYFTIGHNAFEFLLDFYLRYQENAAVSQARIITNPAYAKQLLDLLRESIEQYERAFGVIREG